MNGGNHEHGYTTLHFAALAGKVDCCKILLENGVKFNEVNSVKRTASQMAAFVGKQIRFEILKDCIRVRLVSGNHECVSVINNYIPKDQVLYYTQKQPFEEQPKLPRHLATPLYELIMQV